MPEIMVTTLYGTAVQAPLVQLEVPNGMVQLSIEEAEDVARNIVHACEASLTDAFLIEFFRSPGFNLGDEQVFGLLNEFRKWRGARIGGQPGDAERARAGGESS